MAEAAGTETTNRLDRWSPLTGIAFAALFVLVQLAFVSGTPGAEDSDDEITRYYSDSGNQVQAEVGYLLLTLAAVLFLWFAGTLAGRLQAVERRPSWLSRIVLASGAAFASVLIIGSALVAMVPDVSNDSSAFRLDPNTTRVLTDASYTLVYETALPLVAPLVLAASLVFLRSRAVPRWLGRAGVVIAVTCLAGFLGIPMGLFLIWTSVVSVLLVRRTPLNKAGDSPLPTG